VVRSKDERVGGDPTRNLDFLSAEIRSVFLMAGFIPAIHAFLSGFQNARDI
jgi:hypothetical protein